MRGVRRRGAVQIKQIKLLAKNSSPLPYLHRRAYKFKLNQYMPLIAFSPFRVSFHTHTYTNNTRAEIT